MFGCILEYRFVDSVVVGMKANLNEFGLVVYMEKGVHQGRTWLTAGLILAILIID